VCLRVELEHVEPVDQRSAIRKADAVLPAFARAGQRHDTLKRVAQRGRCRLLFLVGVKHVTSYAFRQPCCVKIAPRGLFGPLLGQRFLLFLMTRKCTGDGPSIIRRRCMWYDTCAPISLIHPFVQAPHLCYQLFEQWPQRRFATASRVKDQTAEYHAPAAHLV
jgi:hypothetical protein